VVYTKPGIHTSQCTIKDTVHYVGVGLHNGCSVSMTLHPAAPNSGVCFVRKDVDARQSVIAARWQNIVDTRLCTVLGNEHGFTVSTVEHLLAALRGCGVDNLLIEISGEEVAILDGSSAQLVEIIKTEIKYRADRGEVTGSHQLKLSA
jgi:UDP-3-O-[3-hydroxymyristoyl] N-acetylglucosamine deacetylase